MPQKKATKKKAMEWHGKSVTDVLAEEIGRVNGWLSQHRQRHTEEDVVRRLLTVEETVERLRGQFLTEDQLPVSTRDRLAKVEQELNQQLIPRVVEIERALAARSPQDPKPLVVPPGMVVMRGPT